MSILYFQREFTKGYLKGLTQVDTITCTSDAACAEWANAINSPKIQKRLNYKVTDKSFQKFWRD